MQAIMEPQIRIDGQDCRLFKAGTLWAELCADISGQLQLSYYFGEDTVFGGLDLMDLVD